MEAQDNSTVTAGVDSTQGGAGIAPPVEVATTQQGQQHATVQPVNQTQEVPAVEVPQETSTTLSEGNATFEIPPELEEYPQVVGVFKIAQAQYPDLDIERVISRAWETGDPELIDYNHIREVVGEDFAEYYGEYFRDIVDSYVEHQAAELDTWTKGVMDKVGGEDQWNRIAEVFNNNAEEHIKEHVIELLNSPSKTTRDVGVDLVISMARSLGAMPTTGGRRLSANTAPATGSTGLSGEEYQKLFNELVQSGDYSESQVNDLRQRRMIGMKQGL